jgi:hypothetical protein
MILPALIQCAMQLLPSRSWAVLVAVSSFIGVLMALAIPVHVH